MQLLSTNGTFSGWSTSWDEGWSTASSRLGHPWLDAQHEQARDAFEPLKRSHGSQISSSCSSDALLEEPFCLEPRQRARARPFEGVSPWAEHDPFGPEPLNPREAFSSHAPDGAGSRASVHSESAAGALMASPFSNMSKGTGISAQRTYPGRHPELQMGSAGLPLQRPFCSDAGEPGPDAVHPKKSPESSIKTGLYKTELCRNWEESGECRYGLKCQFAHGYSELRNLLRHPKYKTSPCKTFMEIGSCPYGQRCCFSHVREPAKPKKADLPQPFDRTPFQSFFAQLSNPPSLRKHDRPPHLGASLQIASDKYISGFSHLFNDTTLLDEISPFVLD